MFPSVRKEPGPGVGTALPSNFLKHADEQTVAGLSAVLHAIADFGMADTCFRDWGIVAAPCFLGRITLASALEQFAIDGPWGLSPHFIPHKSQHAVSGTISLALKIHGPNFGAGGGPTSAVESLLAGAVLLTDDSVPGVWVVITDWDPELIPVRDGEADGSSLCTAVALALTSHQPGSFNPILKIARVPGAAHVYEAEPALADVTAVLSSLARRGRAETSVGWKSTGGGWIEFWAGRPQSALPAPRAWRRLKENPASYTAP
jgi:hypothetical protein